jgi:hypothetical protein
MQEGYSFMGMQGDTYAAHQDLGKFVFLFFLSIHQTTIFCL